ncbi:30S ribosomal protein S1 [Desulfobulbus rhabdoformis]|uniref:30S ribosomal protein S1 n=1 Tax=Desulfobulbus rhabdoformis TaxID=34032 RepID=UPI001966BE8A|nr:30S ribosomal protein S1 [Desulfobulbus rhabdoformis]MBM9614329.1 30S ribosomal protein S1 [Desulfobulbus rhabdoformis]
MSDETFADLIQAQTVSQTALKPGTKIEARIVGISGESIFLDVGGKSEGVLQASELRNEEDELTVSIGEAVQVFFLAARGGEMLFTTRLGSNQSGVRELEDAFQAGIPVEGKVTGEVKGGFSVTVANQRCFCPYSQMDVRKVESADEYLEKTMTFKIIEFSNQGRNIILSARAIQEEQRREQREALKEQLSEGDQVSGVVTSIRDFGAFVDIGGVDGLIPISELAWGQTDRVDDVLERGQQVEVMVKRLDWDRDRISLSLRETLPNPWDTVITKYPVGSIQQGTVCRLANFGAFITLEPGIDGLMHISKLGAGRRINHPREVVEVGQEMTVKIESIDEAQKRIALVPEDFVAKEGSSPNKREDYMPPPASKESQSMGTLGDLLKSQLKKKK